MKKTTLIIGPDASGKSVKAKEMASISKKQNMLLNVSDKNIKTIYNSFRRVRFNKSTQSLLVDSVSDIRVLEFFVFMNTTGFIIENRNELPFRHFFEEIIIVVDSNIKLEDLEKRGASFTRRVNIINFFDSEGLSFERKHDLAFVLGCIAYKQANYKSDKSPFCFAIQAIHELEKKENFLVNLKSTFDFFKSNGGYDDIEVLLNVLPKFQEKFPELCSPTQK